MFIASKSHHAASDLSRTVIFIDGMYIRAAHILIFIADHTGSIKDLCTHLSLVNMMSKCNLMVMYVVTQIHTLEHYLVLCRKSRINKCAVAIQHLKLLWQKEEGGIVECRSTSCLPRNRRQVSNARYSSASWSPVWYYGDVYEVQVWRWKVCSVCPSCTRIFVCSGIGAVATWHRALLYLWRWVHCIGIWSYF